MHMKHKIITIGYTGWCGLGFIRGINYYKYNHNKYENTEPYVYSNSMIHGLFGIIIYANPILWPITLHKELYRFEINIRKLESQKDRLYYNSLL
jgi:hypothetical protein